MSQIRSLFLPLTSLFLLSSMNSCKDFAEQPSFTPTEPSPSIVETVPADAVATSPEASVPETPVEAPNDSPTPVNTVTVTIYQVDSQCSELVPETIQVPAEEAMDRAIAQVLQKQNNVDFEVSGYRLSQQPDGTVVLDLRLPPDAERSFASLSACEQFALFGSLRETLISNSQWGVRSVRFTDRGTEIAY